jgi:hypothetical protein
MFAILFSGKGTLLKNLDKFLARILMSLVKIFARILQGSCQNCSRVWRLNALDRISTVFEISCKLYWRLLNEISKEFHKNLGKNIVRFVQNLAHLARILHVLQDFVIFSTNGKNLGKNLGKIFEQGSYAGLVKFTTIYLYLIETHICYIASK